MSKLVHFRTQKNLTQEELSELSGLSVRTIQRIEAGNSPKGHTLKALCKALELKEEDFIEDKPEVSNESKLVYINYASLLFFIPFLNIVIPFYLLKYYQISSKIGKQIITIQIIWTVISLLVIAFTIFSVGWFNISRDWTLRVGLIFAIVNVFIVLSNSIGLTKKGKLLLSPNFSLI
ncbi:MAG: helix-turn-helix transcriptional regulator [Flavobacteriaceae bacterium]|nr:helix-turn-helix transcriptional regulator [Flavobacteriaceae bacterium]